MSVCGCRLLNKEEAGPIMAHYDANGDDSVTWKEYLQKEHDYTLVKLETDRAKDDVDLAQTLQVGGATRGQRMETSDILKGESMLIDPIMSF